MRRVAMQFPIMTDADFVAAIERAVGRQVPPEDRPYFEHRLAWLRQIASEQKREESSK